MADLIKQRRDTLVNWKRYNPVLADGETALVATDPDKPKAYDGRKVGDGVSTFNELPFQEGHTHENKSDLDKLSLDGDGYICTTQDDDTERAKVGYADLAGDVEEGSPLFDKVLRKDRDDRTDYALTVGGEFTAEKNAKVADNLSVGQSVTVGDSLTVEKKTTMKGGAQFGESYAPGILTGFGGYIDENGNAELQSAVIRSSLTVPELRYNRTRVIQGDTWNAPGEGIFKSVEPDKDSDGSLLMTGTGRLRLEDGEYGAIDVGDICMGIFHSENTSQNATVNQDDSRGNFLYAGFYTCYFTITSVSGSNNEEFRYQLRPVSSRWTMKYHPSASMTFVGYGSFTNEDRQTSVYRSRTYTRLLKGQNTWEIGVNNIAMQYGDLTNLSIHGLDMDGYSMYLSNIYMKGKLVSVNSNGDEIKTANDRGEWTEGTRAEYWDRFSYNGGIWLCVAEDGTTSAPSNGDAAWLCQVTAGDTGRGIDSVDVFYALGDDMINAPTTGWQTTAPGYVEGKYYWTKTVITYTDGTTTETDPLPATGEAGTTGATGVGVKDITEYYYLSTSLTELLGGSWSTARPTWQQGRYIWTKSIITYTDGSTSETTPICAAGDKGDTGEKGDKGDAGDSPSTQGNWYSGLTVPYLGIVTMGGSTFMAKHETTNPPLYCYLDSNGNYLTYSDGGYVLTGVQNTEDYELLVQAAKDGRDGTDTEWIFCRTAEYSRPSTPSTSQTDDYIPSGWYDDPEGVTESYPFEWASTRHKVDGVWSSFSRPSLWAKFSFNGQSSFPSYVFCRASEQPATPTGGSYDDPVPSGWSDGIPDGTGIVWMSLRMFSSDGKSPQSDTWSEPTQMTDTASFDVEFSSLDAPGLPSGHPNTNTQWSNDAGEDTLWMATSRCINGVWEDWTMFKVKGEKGDAGRGITLVDVFYALGDDMINAPTTGWQTTAPAYVEGKFFWTKTVTTYSDGSTTETDPLPATGEAGATGATGVGVKDITEYYYLSTSLTSLSGGSWSTERPSWQQGRYIWTKSIIIYTDGSTSETTPICAAGDKGDTGEKGDQGETGATGAQGEKGEKGDQGETGAQGPTGATGDKGDSVTACGNWKSGMTVPYLGMVTMGGCSFIALHKTTNPPLYCYLDSNGNRLTYSDGTYILTGEQNTTDYQVGAEKGDKGQDGADGQDGAQGEKGDKGEKGDTGAEGKQGIQGCIIRKSEYNTVTQYRNDEALTTGTRYVDIVLKRDSTVKTGWQVRKCIKTTPSEGGIAFTDTEYFEEFDVNVAYLFTSLIIADDAEITFMQGNQLLIKKDDDTVTAGLSGSTDGKKVRMWAGSTIPDNAPFRVDEDGNLTATNAEVTGAIHATSGEFSGEVTARTSYSPFRTIEVRPGWAIDPTTYGSNYRVIDFNNGASLTFPSPADYDGLTILVDMSTGFDWADSSGDTPTIMEESTVLSIVAKTSSGFYFVDARGTTKSLASTLKLYKYSGITEFFSTGTFWVAKKKF